jgi:hypothetical protein
MDFIEEFDTAIKLWGDGDIIEAISESAEEDIYEFAETMALISKYHFTPKGKPNKNFSFVANSSLSGGSHPCSDPGCRKRNIDNLCSFATLYADEVYIQNPFENLMLRGGTKIREVDRQELIAGVFNYLYLRPLIDRGVIKYATNMMAFCEHHMDSLAKPLSDEIFRREEKLKKLLHSNLLDHCSVTFNYPKTNDANPFFEISGPEELIEHGGIYFHAYDPIPPVFSKFQGNGDSYRLSRAEIEDNEILRHIIDPILNDLSMQEWHSALRGTSYLCDNKAQMKIAMKLNSKAYTANATAFEKGMQHYLPAVFSQDVGAIVSLRDREEEAFLVYRDKVHAMMKESKSWDEDEVARMFRDQILPEINIIDKKVNDWKSNIKESISEKLIFGAGAVTVGLYAGFLPADIGSIIAALGGGSAVAGSVMDYNKTFKEKQEARSSDFYFLWQASK